MLTPLSGVAGIAWPGLPSPREDPCFALLYQLEHSQWWPAEVLLAHQLRQLESLVAHAAREVPFYRDRLDAVARLAPGRLTLEAWRGIPPLRRADIQESGEALVARHLPRDHGRPISATTSGSMGRPIRVESSAVSDQFGQAVKMRAHFWHRRDLTGKMASIRRFTPELRKLAESGRRVTWVVGYATGPLTHRDIGGSFDGHLEWLEAQNPDYLETYATAARALAERAAERGLALPRLREVDTGGEVLVPAVRAACKRAWGVPVIDVYAAMETGVIAHQCPESEHYHVQGETLLVEVLDDGGEPCAPGAVGRVVVTTLHNFRMPLIRYEIGDYAEAGGPCPCGRGLPVLRRIMGRARNMVTLPSGERTWARIAGAPLTEIAPLRQLQMVQRKRDEIEVRLVVTRPLSRDEEAALRDALVEALGYPFALRFDYVDDIPRSAGGKFEDFRSELDA